MPRLSSPQQVACARSVGISGSYFHLIVPSRAFNARTYFAPDDVVTFRVSPTTIGVDSCISLVTDRRSFRNLKSRQSLVNGQYVIVARQAYEAIGTHAAVRQYSSTNVSLGYLAKLQSWMALVL